MRLHYCFSIALAIILTPAVASANLLDDGSFDDATSGSQTSGSDWTLTVNFPDGLNPAARFQTGFGNAENNSTQSPGTGNGVWFRPFEGAQAANDPLAQATISQSIVAPASGDYGLDFLAAIEGIVLADEFSVTLSSSGSGGSATVDLLTAGMASGNIGGAASATLGGTPFVLQLFGVTAGDILTVSGDMVNGSDRLENPQSGFLDAFNLKQIPEPTSVLLLAMAAASFAIRQRR